jgi:hypothetical protein
MSPLAILWSPFSRAQNHPGTGRELSPNFGSFPSSNEKICSALDHSPFRRPVIIAVALAIVEVRRRMQGSDPAHIVVVHTLAAWAVATAMPREIIHGFVANRWYPRGWGHTARLRRVGRSHRGIVGRGRAGQRRNILPARHQEHPEGLELAGEASVHSTSQRTRTQVKRR